MPKVGDMVRFRDDKGEEVRAQISDFSRGPNKEVPDPDGDGTIFELGDLLDGENLAELAIMRVRKNGDAVEHRLAYGRSKVPLAKNNADRQKPGFWWPDIV
jgi:hypothetical protein